MALLWLSAVVVLWLSAVAVLWLLRDAATSSRITAAAIQAGLGEIHSNGHSHIDPVARMESIRALKS